MASYGFVSDQFDPRIGGISPLDIHKQQQAEPKDPVLTVIDMRITVESEGGESVTFESKQPVMARGNYPAERNDHNNERYINVTFQQGGNLSTGVFNLRALLTAINKVSMEAY